MQHPGWRFWVWSKIHSQITPNFAKRFEEKSKLRNINACLLQVKTQTFLSFALKISGAFADKNSRRFPNYRSIFSTGEVGGIYQALWLILEKPDCQLLVVGAANGQIRQVRWLPALLATAAIFDADCFPAVRLIRIIGFLNST